MLPTREEALALLEWAHEQNPGPWREHSLNAARVCEGVAAAAGLDADRAFILGALHDIGRWEGVRSAHHIIAGYRLMMEKGWDEAARICMTHSFPDRDLDNHFGWDVTEAERAEIQAFVDAAEFDDYDRLVQLADALAMAEGVCLMEKRRVDVALRYGMRPGLVNKWRAFMDIRRDFEDRIGRSVYDLFPEAAEVTFGRKGGRESV